MHPPVAGDQVHGLDLVAKLLFQRCRYTSGNRAIVSNTAVADLYLHEDLLTSLLLVPSSLLYSGAAGKSHPEGTERDRLPHPRRPRSFSTLSPVHHTCPVNLAGPVLCLHTDCGDFRMTMPPSGVARALTLGTAS